MHMIVEQRGCFVSKHQGRLRVEKDKQRLKETDADFLIHRLAERTETQKSGHPPKRMTGSQSIGSPSALQQCMRMRFAPSVPRRCQSIGLRLATIAARCGSRNGASTTFSPSVATSSSTPNPGPSEAISNRMPFGSRKYRLRNQ
jgi:hypothetical protein